MKVCCRTDFKRDIVRLFCENGNDLDEVARLLGRAKEEIPNYRRVIAERLAERLSDQGEPDRQHEKSAKKLKAVRPRHKNSDNWIKDSPMSSGKKRNSQRV